MQNQTPFRDPYLRRFVHDCDDLADVLHSLVDTDHPPYQRSGDAPQEMEFTTEWQMVTTAEESHQD